MKKKPIGIVVSRFNETITHSLLKSCEDTLQAHGYSASEREVFWVPGAFELPLGAQKILAHKDFDAVICLGCVVQGETPHFDFVCSETARGIQNISLRTGVPIIFGVITAASWDQALIRAGLESRPSNPFEETTSPKKVLNKGVESAEAALDMVSFTSQLRKEVTNIGNPP